MGAAEIAAIAAAGMAAGAINTLVGSGAPVTANVSNGRTRPRLGGRRHRLPAIVQLLT